MFDSNPFGSRPLSLCKYFLIYVHIHNTKTSFQENVYINFYTYTHWHYFGIISGPDAQCGRELPLCLPVCLLKKCESELIFWKHLSLSVYINFYAYTHSHYFDIISRKHSSSNQKRNADGNSCCVCLLFCPVSVSFVVYIYTFILLRHHSRETQLEQPEAFKTAPRPPKTL